MRLSVSGTANQGKTTVIKDFTKKWPQYKECAFSYRDLLESQNLPHSKETNKDTQWAILNKMCEEILSWDLNDKIIMDRNPIDNIVYSLWAYENNVGDIDDKFIEQCIPLVHESMRAFDIIFFIPLTKAHKIEIVDDGTRETDETYIKEIDAIFKALIYQYRTDLKSSPWFPTGDSPAIIEIFGDPTTRMYMIDQYIDIDGDLIEPDGQTFSEENIQQMEKLLQDQQSALLQTQLKQLNLSVDQLNDTKNN